MESPNTDTMEELAVAIERERLRLAKANADLAEIKVSRERGDCGPFLGTLYGRPVIVSEFCKPLGSVGDAQVPERDPRAEAVFSEAVECLGKIKNAKAAANWSCNGGPYIIIGEALAAAERVIGILWTRSKCRSIDETDRDEAERRKIVADARLAEIRHG